MRSIATSCLLSTSMPSPPPWPVTSADGEYTRKYSAESTPDEPSAKLTSSACRPCLSLSSSGGGTGEAGPVMVGVSSNSRLEDVAAQVLVREEIAEMAIDVGCIDLDALAALVRGFERNRFEQPLEHRMQAPRADVLGPFVEAECDFGDAPDARRRKGHRDAFGRKQAPVLLRQRGIGLRENALALFRAARRELD